MGKVDQTLLIRALNATRPYYFPTYLGLRLIADQLPKRGDGYLARMVIRRLNAADMSRFKRFDLYKSTSQLADTAAHEYRPCLAPSPTTALAEALLLTLFSEEHSFRTSPRVYSYQWPTSRTSSGSYEFYISGYKKRNQDIANELVNDDHCAIVTDIRKFYPSISVDRVKESLGYALAKTSKLRASTEEIMQFFLQMMSTSPNGVPISPASSHLLGNLALGELDSHLASRHGARYFRYVDDIVVVCRKDEQKKIESELRSSIVAAGFNVNEEKTNVLTATDWTASLIRHDVAPQHSFRQLCRDLPIYLAYFPKRATELSRMFADAGLRIPFARLKALSKYPKFHYVLRIGTPEIAQSVARVLFATNGSLLARGIQTKKIYEEALAQLLDEKPMPTANVERWNLQRVRRVVNTLFYLRRFDEWSPTAPEFVQYPVLVEQLALATALSSGNANPILPFYSNGPAALSELWNEYGQGALRLEQPTEGFSGPELDSYAYLRTYGVLPAISLSRTASGSATRILRSIEEDGRNKREIADLSFEDEFESLCLGRSRQQLENLSQSRYSLSEGIGMDALTLLGANYSG